MSDPYQLRIERGANARGYWRDLWSRRNLVTDMAWRDISVRYKQTYLGLAWTLVTPIVSMLVFTLLFHRLAKLGSEGGAPYPIMVFAALIPWQLFSQALTGVSTSMVGSSSLIERVYFPRLAIPLKAVIVAAFNTAIATALLALVMLGYGFAPSWHVVFLPLFLLLAALTALGLGLWVAVLNVRYRDFQYLVPYVLQMAMYISPVGFKTSVVPGELRFIYSLNPMVGVIDGARWSLLGGDTPLDATALAISIAFVLLALAGGLWFFRRSEGTFADRI